MKNIQVFETRAMTELVSDELTSMAQKALDEYWLCFSCRRIWLSV